MNAVPIPSHHSYVFNSPSTICLSDLLLTLILTEPLSRSKFWVMLATLSVLSQS